jgi:FKBP-type peptidyl-prolyl cis-trans isomerase
MSARELRGRKRLQSNADEALATAKRSKNTNTDEEEGDIEVEQQPVKKTTTKGKGKGAKKLRCVTYSYEGLLPAYNPSVG